MAHLHLKYYCTLVVEHYANIKDKAKSSSDLVWVTFADICWGGPLNDFRSFSLAMDYWWKLEDAKELGAYPKVINTILSPMCYPSLVVWMKFGVMCIAMVKRWTWLVKLSNTWLPLEIKVAKSTSLAILIFSPYWTPRCSYTSTQGDHVGEACHISIFEKP